MPSSHKTFVTSAGLATREARVSAFREFDLDGSGFITIDEVMRIMCRDTEHKAQFTIAEAKEHLDEFDADQNHRWSLDEFLAFCEGTNDHGHSHDTMVAKALTGRAAKLADAGLADHEDVVAAFEAFDKDLDGRVTEDEIIKIKCRDTEFGAQFTQEEAREHLEEFDSNRDGHWSFEEFVRFCEGTNDHGHGHDTMVKKALVGQSAPPRLDQIQAALAVFDESGRGYLTEAAILTILTLDRGNGSALSPQMARRIMERCAQERDAVGSVSCDAFCRALASPWTPS